MEKNIVKKDEAQWVKHPKLDGVYLKRYFVGADNNNLFDNLLAKIEPGKGLPPHTHDNSIETYYLIQGKGECLSNGEWREVNVGDCCTTPMGNEHGFRNVGEEDCILFSTFTPAVPPAK